MLIRLISAVGLVAIFAATIRADTVEVSGGGHVAGSKTVVASVGDSEFKKDYVWVKVDDTVRIAIQKSRVRRVKTNADLDKYRVELAKHKQEAADQFKLAQWCVENGYDDQYKFHLKRVIALDPNHEAARSRLSYVKDSQGNWVLYSQQQRNRGMISVGGRWQYPESVSKQNAQSEAKVQSGQWVRELGLMKKAYLGRHQKRSAEAWEKLKAINDPLASVAIADELKKSRKLAGQRNLRLLWVELLGKFRNPIAVRALVEAGLDEPDSVVREAAMDELKEYGYMSAKATCIPMLKSNSRDDVRNALSVLSYFPDPELAMTYVDALVTTHKAVVKPAGPGTNAGFTQNGSGSFSTGGKAQVRIDTVQNSIARKLLTEIEPDVDHGFDKTAWRNYFSQKRMAYSGSLRHDP